MRPARLASITFAAAAALFLLSGCGGGGGGNSSPPPPPPVGLVLVVKVNNVVVTPAANAVTLGNGDTVTVESAVAVTWVATTPGALVTNNVVAPNVWTARLAKQSLAAASYSLQAMSSTGGGGSATLTFNIPAGDVRSGEYKMLSAGASEYRLRIDFDALQYTVFSGSNPVSTGTFSGPVDGTYTFTVPGYTPARNNARFRTASGVIVGSHPVGGPEALPFVAANHFVTSAQDMPTTNMWMFSRDVVPTENPVTNSRIMSIRLAGNQITYCSVPVGAVTTVAACLPANLANHGLIFNADRSITWDDAGTPVNLHVVRAEGELFLVRAQSYATGVKRFQIALDDTKALGAATYEGGISNGSWGTTATLSGFFQSAVTSAMVPDEVIGTLNGAGANAAPLRVVAGSDVVNYFVLGTGLLETHIAARGSTKAGQVGVGLRR